MSGAGDPFTLFGIDEPDISRQVLANRRHSAQRRISSSPPIARNFCASLAPSAHIGAREFLQLRLLPHEVSAGPRTSAKSIIGRMWFGDACYTLVNHITLSMQNKNLSVTAVYDKS
jgi:hypothetical protein